MSALTSSKSLGSAHMRGSCRCAKCMGGATASAIRPVVKAPSMASAAGHSSAPGCQCRACVSGLGVAKLSRRGAVVARAAAADSAQDKDRIAKLLVNNREWASSQVKYDPTFFNRLRDQQTPEYLWIGCSDSRVPANTIVGLDPGEVFVQRNVGNQASHGDMNTQACIEFSVKALGVKTIIVCGHYKCGAVKAALTLPQRTPGLVNCWIADIREARNQHAEELKGLTEDEQVEKLCEFNVLRQTFHVCTSPTVQETWDSGKELTVYGVVYDLSTGLLKHLAGPITSNDVLGTTDQEVFVSNSMQKVKAEMEAGVKAEMQAALAEGAAATAPPKALEVANTEKLAQKLAVHAAWDKGAI